MSELYEKATPRPWAAHRTKGQTCSEIQGADGSWVAGPEMDDCDADLTCHAVNNVERLEAQIVSLREALESHPGWSADVTFAAIWKWLAKRDEALGIIHEEPDALSSTGEG